MTRRWGGALAAAVGVTVWLAVPSLEANAKSVQCIGFTATIVGTPHRDLIVGTPHRDVIVGLGGNDVIRGRGGSDVVCGSGGDDRIAGGPGTDVLNGDRGDDRLLGRTGNDLLLDGPGDDVMDGGGGGDEVSYALAARGIDADLSEGTATGFGADLLVHVEGLIGSLFDDTLTGDDADNEFLGLPGNDTIDGAGGVDTASFLLSGGPVTADLSTGTATGEGTDTMADIEDLVGSDSGDTLTGDGGDNHLSGFLGDDTLDGGAGDDTLDGGDGTDLCLNGESDVNCEA